MGLTLISTPIGHSKDITLRALDSLKTADIVIGEERKPLFRLFASLGLPKPEKYELLNEHSSDGDYQELLKICNQQNVALVTDCGTPGFCDPGAKLVDLCRRNKIPVTSHPGASSLMTFLSLTGIRLDQFYFQGFLPRESADRIKRLKHLDQKFRPYILMDTPYRLSKTLSQCQDIHSSRQAVIGVDLTSKSEEVFHGTVSQILKKFSGQKREFLLLIL